MEPIKRIVLKFLAAAGYELHRRPSKSAPEADLDLYLRLYGREAVENRRFYNIGAGKFRHAGWTNVDHWSEWYGGILGGPGMIDWDLMSLTPLPVESDSAEAVYTSHTIEHVTDEADANMFRQTYRVLKKGRCFRVTAPDIELAFQAYRRGDRDYFYYISLYSDPKECERVKLRKRLCDASLAQVFLWFIASNASPLHADGAPRRITDRELERIFHKKDFEDALDYCCSCCCMETQKKYPGNHCNWFTRAKTKRMLRDAGFEDVYDSGYGQSRCPVMRDTRLFDNSHPEVSFYVEATK